MGGASLWKTRHDYSDEEESTMCMQIYIQPVLICDSFSNIGTNGSKEAVNGSEYSASRRRTVVANNSIVREGRLPSTGKSSDVVLV